MVDVEVRGTWVTLGREGVIAGEAWTPAGCAYIVTAYNPGRAVAADVNEAAQQRLLDYLARENIVWLPAVGRSRDSQHQEPSVALLRVSAARATDIGTLFKQDAIFSWDGISLAVIECPRAH